MQKTSTPPLIKSDWLLSTPQARELYHEFAAKQPIIDYHNHLPPQQIADNHHFANISEAWLAGDHYKWRAMRAHGIEEDRITGTASDRDKFRAYATTVPYTLRNPLFHWSHLELKRYFDVSDYLKPETADAIYDHTSELLRTEDYGTWGLLSRQNVRAVCTTDDPTDDLRHHARFATADADFTMYPAWRPDKALYLTHPGRFGYLEALVEVSGKSISDYGDLLSVLKERMDHFDRHGCRVCDHGLNYVPVSRYDPEVADRVFKGTISGRSADPTEANTFLFTLLVDLGREYHRRGWVFQLHLGALRNNNSRGERELGPDTGFDSIGDFPQAQGLSRLLNTLENTDQLPKTILYNLNPADNQVFATMVGNFARDGGRGKMQWGSGWWFLDQWDGMSQQIEALSNMGLLAHFVGMLTDSRSFLSFPRHEYFRRLLCTIFGEDMASGKLPDDKEWIGNIVSAISYGNARTYFGFPEKGPK